MAKSAKKSKIVIRIEDMHKWYGQFHALKAIHLEVTQGERIVICDHQVLENQHLAAA